MREIEIDGKKYEIKCTAFTRFQYKKIFGVGIFEDLKILDNFNAIATKEQKKLTEEGKKQDEIDEAINKLLLDRLDDYWDAILRIAYIEIWTANPKIMSFDEWLASLEKVSLGDKWIAEVTEYAVTSFC